MIDLEPIKKRLEAATPGPWYYNLPDGTSIHDFSDEGPYDVRGIDLDGYLTVWDEKENSFICQMMDLDNKPMGNLDLITNAPTDIFRIVREVERLQSALEKIMHVSYWGSILQTDADPADSYGSGQQRCREIARYALAGSKEDEASD